MLILEKRNVIIKTVKGIKQTEYVFILAYDLNFLDQVTDNMLDIIFS